MEDFTLRPVMAGGRDGVKIFFCFVDGLVSGRDAGDLILRALRECPPPAEEQAALEHLLHGGAFTAETKRVDSLDGAADALTQGCCLLIFDGLKAALSLQQKGMDKRAVSEPSVENVVKGAKDSFIEDIRTNTALVRKKLRTPQLTAVSVTVGRKSRTKADVLWVEGVADVRIVDAMKARAASIDIDGFLATAAVEEYISDNPASMLPQLIYTERPARFASHLLEGRVGLLIDGLPLGYIAPGTLPQHMRAPEDKANNYVVASFLVLLRYVCLLISLLAPAVYIAISSFHQEMLPTNLLLSVMQSKERLPFSTAAEIIAMLIAFEMLQEAGLRMPRNIGQTVSIIGALIVGESAVSAGFISPAVVIVVALAGITGFVIPNQDLASALRVWRLGLAFAGAVLGLYAVAMGLALLIFIMAGAESFGVPYLAPLVSSPLSDTVKFALTQPPLYRSTLREEDLNTPDRRNQKERK